MSKTTMAPSSTKYPHPIYMDPDLQNIPKLTNETVHYWKLAMLNHIEANGLTAFIDGSIQPPAVDNPDYAEWKEMDDIVHTSITSTIPDDFFERIMSSPSITGKELSAAELWKFIIENVYRPPGMNHPDRVSIHVEGRCNIIRYLPLHKAALEGNLHSLEKILKNEPTAVRAMITGASETALMIASQKKGNNDFVKKLISLMTPEDLAIQSSFGRTAMFGAAMVGNVDAMKLMVDKNPRLPNISDMGNQIPLHLAASTAQKDSVNYLMKVTNEEFLKDLRGVLVHALILGGFFDICLSLLQRFPTLAVIDISPLESLTMRHSAFLSGVDFNFWERMVYSYLPDELENLKNYCVSGDTENPKEEVSTVPQIKRIQEKKVMHNQALQLLIFICFEVGKMESKKVRDIIGHPLAHAASMGNVEVVEEILTIFPNAIHLLNPNKHSVFHMAILNRKANVFNLIYQVTTLRHLFLAQRDVSYNTALHLVAHFGGENGDNDIRSSGPGAALQMQRELQWFKEVERLSWPQDQETWNINGKTPSQIFTETHELLAKEGEQWMKDRANSGIIIATLIATIVFTSAITVPGGTNNDTGLPIFSKHKAFIIFAVSDALALFMSASSMLMFLGILTARYAVQDFLYTLPKRLIIALITLFLSIIFMMIAFTSTLYLVFGNEKRWVLALVSSMATIPVLLFATLQFKPLLEIVSSTYGSGIFGKRGDRILL
ncbi:hypothetical protein SSX86_018516 [Deinandra increscens subsp. villosa]|uniref:PGG domain-containing protein n=1 Tax=Deinandra increscens subsp. villosa TaxID=3103831 RepID=A0AAP0GTM0_9ASTR